jgi:hypothetical protein
VKRQVKAGFSIHAGKCIDFFFFNYDVIDQIQYPYPAARHTEHLEQLGAAGSDG